MKAIKFNKAAKEYIERMQGYIDQALPIVSPEQLLLRPISNRGYGLPLQTYTAEVFVAILGLQVKYFRQPALGLDALMQYQAMVPRMEQVLCSGTFKELKEKKIEVIGQSSSDMLIESYAISELRVMALLGRFDVCRRIALAWLDMFPDLFIDRRLLRFDHNTYPVVIWLLMLLAGYKEELRANIDYHIENKADMAARLENILATAKRLTDQEWVSLYVYKFAFVMRAFLSVDSISLNHAIVQIEPITKIILKIEDLNDCISDYLLNDPLFLDMNLLLVARLAQASGMVINADTDYFDSQLLKLAVERFPYQAADPQTPPSRLNPPVVVPEGSSPLRVFYQQMEHHIRRAVDRLPLGKRPIDNDIYGALYQDIVDPHVNIDVTQPLWYLSQIIDFIDGYRFAYLSLYGQVDPQQWVRNNLCWLSRDPTIFQDFLAMYTYNNAIPFNRGIFFLLFVLGHDESAHNLLSVIEDRFPHDKWIDDNNYRDNIYLHQCVNYLILNKQSLNNLLFFYGDPFESLAIQKPKSYLYYDALFAVNCINLTKAIAAQQQSDFDDILTEMAKAWQEVKKRPKSELKTQWDLYAGHSVGGLFQLLVIARKRGLTIPKGIDVLPISEPWFEPWLDAFLRAPEICAGHM